MDEEEKSQNHRGVISVSMPLMKTLLQLPKHYEVETLHLDWSYNKLRIYVTSPELPPVGEYQQVTEVIPKYRWSDREGVVSASPELVDIEIKSYPPRTKEELLASL